MWKLVLSNVSVKRGVLYPDIHGFLDGPGLAVYFFMNYAELVGSMGWPVVELWRCMGEGALKCSLILSPSVLPDSPMYELGQFMWGIGSGR